MYVQHELTKGLLSYWSVMTATAEHFVKGPTNISRTSNCNKLLSTYLFCICGLFCFYLWLLIHNNKLEHREANNKINLNHRTRANRKCWTWRMRIRFAAVLAVYELPWCLCFKTRHVMLARSCSGHMFSAINVFLTFPALCFTHRSGDWVAESFCYCTSFECLTKCVSVVDSSVNDSEAAKAKLVTTVRHASGMCHYITHIFFSSLWSSFVQVLPIYLAKLFLVDEHRDGF